MKIVSTNVYVGPNIYAHFPVIRHVLDLGELEDWPTGRLGKAFIDPLLELRNRFREEQKWEEADRIRDILNKAQIIVEDTQDGSQWRIK